MPIAVLRRVAGFVPYGELLPIPYHFTIRSGERQIGELTRAFSIRDRYLLDLSSDVERAIDRRLAVAFGIGMDALQAR
jgi:hypothetical protein